ncbi:MAG: chemotaxis protein methyltransferase CheR [Methyloprofundus sp.]|nr:MAG: chemotaxis protein methyltransferase CheR [Methyloprofundus sp.]
MAEKQREFEYTRADFEELRQISNSHSGIIVTDDKFDMFYSRLSKRIRMLGLPNFKAYCQYLKENEAIEFTDFINAITTNLTAFFRENHHFEYVKDIIIPELLKRNHASREIKVWSAGCSTGEEPYSIAMTLLENLPTGWTVKILATDLDTNVLQTAANGVYSDDRISGLSNERQKRWFKKGKGSNSNKVKVKPELQELIRFKKLNLMQDWPMKGQFDFIFCRNVIIYFDRDTKESLVNRYSGFLATGSHLLIGHSESLHQIDTDFDLIGNTIYRKVR